ncbi:hypothetical protein ACEWY4_025003 [Coilia grayii]|uniref:Pyrin domain-containing protein n=1 Tax=Coilia grayii TaxID=363190 RepID=A0ABD1IWD0_9TELE
MGQFLRKPWNHTCNFLPVLIDILESLSHEEFRKFLSIVSDMSGRYRLPEGKLDGRGRADVATLMNKAWPERLCLTNTRDLLKMIPRNDLERELRPYLRSIGERW